MAGYSSFPTWTGKNADFAEIIKLKLLGSLDIQSMGFSQRDDVQSSLTEYKTPYMDKVTKLRNGCTAASVKSGGLAGAKVILTVTDFEISDGQCAATFDSTIAEQVRKKGYDINNLEGTQIETIIKELVLDAAARDRFRKLWLNDSTSSNSDYTGFDGIYKKTKSGLLAADGTTSAGALVAADFTLANIVATMQRIEDAQSDELKYMPDGLKKMFVTNNIWKAWRRYLQSPTYNVESGKLELINGIEKLYYNGIELIDLGVISKYLGTDFATGSPATIATPYRVLLTWPENHFIVSDALTSSMSLDFWYEKKDDVNYWRMFFKLGYNYAFGEYNTIAGY